VSRGVHGLGAEVSINPSARAVEACRTATEIWSILFFLLGYLLGGHVNGLALMRSKTPSPESDAAAHRPTNLTHGACSWLA